MTEFKFGRKSTVTFMLTDVEGSTRLWETHPNEMREALLVHDELGEKCIIGSRGELIKSRGEGDSLFGVFHSAPAAVAASLDFQKRLQAQVWPENAEIRVRIAIHTGEAEFRETDFYGATVNRCARLRAIAHGRQVLVSEASAALSQDHLPEGASFLPLGARRLKDLHRPEEVFQLVHPDICSEFPELLSLDVLPNNLPVQVTSFVGRAKDLEEIRGLFEKTRLLSLIGAGGSGKTRLSIQLAAELLEEFPDGVWLVELAALNNPLLVSQAVAQILGLTDDATAGIDEKLVNRIADKRILIVLDNCEHVLDACSKLTSTLLSSCAIVKIIVSSREALGVPGELVYRVRSLPIPGNFEKLDVLSASEFGAIQLFVDRAAFLKSDFELTARNVESVAEICTRLDGIPLAIELAAARISALPVEQIAARLADRFRLLTGGSRSAMPRQQTLRALIDWSYELLNSKERILLSRLSVFSGGMTLEAAESVCSDEELDSWDVLDVLTHLVEKSLLIYVDSDSSNPRYRFLETVRQYAIEKLIGTGTASSWHDRHLTYFIELSLNLEPGLRGPDQVQILRTLDLETDNLRTALDWATESNLEQALLLAGTLARFWMLRGHLVEGRLRLEGLLSKTGSNGESIGRAKALNGAGILCWRQGDMATAGKFFEASLKEWEFLGDKPMVASALNNIGLVKTNQGEFGSAADYHKQALELRESLNDEVGIATSLHNIGLLHWTQGQFPEAKDCFERCLVLRRKLGDINGITDLLNNLGATAMREGQFESAIGHYEECLSLYRESGNRSGVAIVLHNLADIYCRQQEIEKAAPLAREALVIALELGLKQLLGPAHLTIGWCAESRSPSEAAVHFRLASQFAASEKDVETTVDALKELGICSDDRSSRIFGLARSLGSRVGPGYRPLRAENCDSVAQRLGVEIVEPAETETEALLEAVTDELCKP